MAKPEFNIKLSRVLLLLLFNFQPSGEYDSPHNSPNLFKAVINETKEDSNYDYSTLYEKPYSTPIIATFANSSGFKDKRRTAHCTTENNTDIMLTNRSRKTFPSFFTQNNTLFVNATRFPYDFVLIGFEQWYKFGSNQIPTFGTFVKGGETKAVPIESLQFGRFYRFCCIEKGMQTALPMDCVSILKFGIQKSAVLIYTKDRLFTILAIIFCGLFSFSFGFGFHFLVHLIKGYPKRVKV